MTIDLFAAEPTLLIPSLGNQSERPSTLPLQELVQRIEKMNHAYRTGAPLVSDAEYDHVWLAELRAREPTHAFLLAPEPEESTGMRVKHLHPMLSTDKAYTTDEVNAWVHRVTAANGGEVAGINVRITPKLDGIACYRASNELAYTRGKGGYGTDISHLFSMTNGVTCGGHIGAGEIVIGKQYFDSVIAEEFGLEHPRNLIAGLVELENFSAHHERAFADGEIRFVAYETLPAAVVALSDLASVWEAALSDLTNTSPYLCDGAVAEVVDPSLRERLGSTSHHHRWQLALKRNDDGVLATVRGVRMTTGRTGRICPTVELEPVSLYGVTITWATAHNHARLLEWQCGPGATVSVLRSGGVIPKITACTAPGDLSTTTLDRCPSCGSHAEMRGPTAFCTNELDCPARAQTRLQHWFKTVGVCKGFGPSVCEALCEAGHTKVSHVFSLSADEMVRAGISSGVAANLATELSEARARPFSEAYFLAAFGIPNLGRGDARHLLEVFDFDALGTITPQQIATVHGFGDKTSGPISNALGALWAEISAVRALGWRLDPVKNQSGTTDVHAPLKGKAIVFTGSMSSGSREEMETNARQLGAIVGSSVSKKTSYLVCGANVGAAKTGKAADLGVTVISEKDYLTLIGSG